MYARGNTAEELLADYLVNVYPVDCGDNWIKEKIQMALLQGLHISERQPGACASLYTEAEAKIKNGFAAKVRWGVLST